MYVGEWLQVLLDQWVKFFFACLTLTFHFFQIWKWLKRTFAFAFTQTHTHIHTHTLSFSLFTWVWSLVVNSWGQSNMSSCLNDRILWQVEKWLTHPTLNSVQHTHTHIHGLSISLALSLFLYLCYFFTLPFHV